MKPIDEIAAITFLRSVLHAPRSVTPEAGVDLGWCAVEHAMIFQLALRAVGTHTNLCTGDLAYFDLEREEQSFQNLNHNFLVDSTELPLVFDSSASFREVAGVPFAWPETYPGLLVMAFEGIPPSGQLRIDNDPRQNPKVACYFVRHEEPLETSTVSFSSESPFSLELEQQFGDQEVLWSKVIGLTIRILERTAPSPPWPMERRYRAALWQWITSRPDERDFIFEKLWD